MDCAMSLDIRYVSIDELHKLSGLSLSTLRRRIKDGTLRPIQPGGPRTRLLFRADVLEQFAVPSPLGPNQTTERAEESERESIDTRSSVRNPGPRPRWLQDRFPNKPR